MGDMVTNAVQLTQVQQQQQQQAKSSGLAGFFGEISNVFANGAKDVQSAQIAPVNIPVYGHFGEFGCFGPFGIFGFGPCCFGGIPFVGSSGFTPVDAIRQNTIFAIGENSRRLANALSTSGHNNGMSGLSSMFNPLSFSGIQQPQKTSAPALSFEINKADCFDKIDNDKMAALQEAEAMLAKAQAEFDADKNSSEKAKALTDAKNKYAELQNGLSDGLIPSEAYGKDFKFGFLGANELKDIKAQNAEISGLKDEAIKLQQKNMELNAKINQARQTLIQQGKNPDTELSTIVAQTDIDSAKANDGRIKELQEQIKAKVELLGKYVAASGKDSTDDTFAVFEAKSAGNVSDKK